MGGVQSTVPPPLEPDQARLKPILTMLPLISSLLLHMEGKGPTMEAPPLSFNLVLLFSILASLPPLGAGLYVAIKLYSKGPTMASLMSGVTLGIVFFAFYDWMLEAGGLGAWLLTTFQALSLITALLLAILAMGFLHLSAKGPGPAPLYLWALAVALHSAGEGLVIGSDFSTGATLLVPSQISSFVLHKMAEGMVLGLLFATANLRLTSALTAFLVSALALPITAPLGFQGILLDTIPFLFSGGIGLLLALLKPFVIMGASKPDRLAPGVILGFLFMQLAGMLHQLP